MNNDTSPDTVCDDPILWLRLDAGPDAGRTITLPGRPLVVGRSHGIGHIADPFIEAHHLLIDPTRRTVMQLSGRVPTRVDGNPIGAAATISDGSVIEVGASRIIVATIKSHTISSVNRFSAGTGRESGGVVELGVGIRRDHEPVSSSSFVDQAQYERTRTTTPITLDLHETRRVLVVGPSAETFVRALAARSAGRRVIVSRRLDLLRTRPRRHVVFVHATDPETGWPSRELPGDAAVVSVGASWQGVLMRRSPDGSMSLQRFHAAGLSSAHGPEGRAPARVCSRSDGALVAEEVARPGAELGGDVVGVPEPARREREAAAPDALVELVAHPGEQRDLLVEARPP